MSDGMSDILSWFLRISFSCTSSREGYSVRLIRAMKRLQSLFGGEECVLMRAKGMCAVTLECGARASESFLRSLCAIFTGRVGGGECTRNNLPS